MDSTNNGAGPSGLCSKKLSKKEKRRLNKLGMRERKLEEKRMAELRDDYWAEGLNLYEVGLALIRRIFSLCQIKFKNCRLKKVDRVLDRFNDYCRRRINENVEIPENVVREINTMYILLMLTRNVFLLKRSERSALEVLPMPVIETSVLKMLYANNTFFEQFLVYREHLKFWMDSDCFTLAKYYLSVMKHLMITYQNYLKKKYSGIDNAPTYDRDSVNLIFFDFHQSVLLYIERLLHYTIHDKTQDLPTRNSVFDHRQGTHLLGSFPGLNFNQHWIVSKVTCLKSVDNLKVCMETSSKLATTFLERSQSRFAFYKKSLMMNCPVNKDRLFHTFNVCELVHQEIYLSSLINFVRIMFVPGLSRNYNTVVESTKKLEILQRTNRNKDTELKILRLIDMFLGRMWRLERNLLIAQGVEYKYGHRELMEITDQRLLVGKTLMTFKGKTEPNIDILYDFVCCFVLARHDREGARPYAQEIYDIFKEREQTREFASELFLEYNEALNDDDQYVDEIIESTLRTEPN